MGAGSPAPAWRPGSDPKHGLQQGVALTDANWRTLAEGRTLLFLHGIFSTSASAFGGLFDTSRPDNAELWAHLERAYDGRIIAFDHPTASVPPEENAAAFLALIPDDVHLELDIVCHSRGGLVARILDGQLPASTSDSLLDVGLLDVLLRPVRWLFGGNRSHATVTVRKIVFVGTPNSGTNIVEEENWNTFVDSFTTLLDVLPPGPWNATTPVFEGVLELVKALAAGTADNLPGLRAMDPDSDLYAGLDALRRQRPAVLRHRGELRTRPSSDRAPSGTRSTTSSTRSSTSNPTTSPCPPPASATPQQPAPSATGRPPSPASPSPPTAAWSSIPARCGTSATSSSPRPAPACSAGSPEPARGARRTRRHAAGTSKLRLSCRLHRTGLSAPPPR